MTKRAGLTGLAGLAGLTGLALFTVTTDREFINLTPSPAQFVTLEAGHTYTQTFPATRTSISRVGVYLRPVGDLPESNVQLAIARRGEVVATQTIPTAAIDIEGTSQVRFADPLPVAQGDTIAFTLTVPDNLTGRIRALQRLPDDTFNSAYAVFSIDRTPQAAPLAYQVYYSFRPPLAFQVGGLLIFTALFLAINVHSSLRITHYALLIPLSIILSILYALPALLLGDRPVTLMAATSLVFLGTALVARRRLPAAPALVTAAITAFTAYWPLRLATSWTWDPAVLGTAASLRDIFLDPRQIPSSAHTAAFEHFGSYIGTMAAILAAIGIMSEGRRRWKTVAALLAALLVSRLIPDAIIIVTALLAFVAGAGLAWLSRFLGDDKLSRVLIIIICLLILLDLFYVAAAPLEFGLL